MHNLQSVRTYRRAVDPSPEMLGFDRLTGLATRKLFQQRLDQQWILSQAEKRSMALMLVDFDHFRDYRASHHKYAANAALASAARVVSTDCRRRADFAGRVRISEYACLLSDVKPEGAQYVADRVRVSIAALQLVRGTEPDSGYLTVSVGIVCLVPPSSHFSAALLIAADGALKSAKEAGRNCVELATSI